MQRRTPLRSSTTLARRTRLTRVGELKRSAELRRAAPMDARRRDTGPSRPVRAVVANRSGGSCEVTHCTARARHVHHRRPRQRGGTREPYINQPGNLLAVCADHHDWIETNRTLAEWAGYLVPRRAGVLPTARPVHWRGTWVLLGDDGSVTATTPPERTAAA